mgnify:CR=1 FL=1
MAIDTVKVAGLMGRIDEELAQVGPVPAAMTDYEGWRAHQGAYRKIIDDLVAEEGAAYRSGSGDGYRLTLAGIATTCTGGDAGLLRNWVNAASRRLAAMQAASAPSEGGAA